MIPQERVERLSRTMSVAQSRHVSIASDVSLHYTHNRFYTPCFSQIRENGDSDSNDIPEVRISIICHSVTMARRW
jgi:hypothetical protein